MRSILNLSLPPAEATAVKKRAKSRGFASASQYVRFLLELDQNLISADDLLKMSARADLEYGNSKLIQRKSLAELI